MKMETPVATESEVGLTRAVMYSYHLLIFYEMLNSTNCPYSRAVGHKPHLITCICMYVRTRVVRKVSKVLPYNDIY